MGASQENIDVLMSMGISRAQAISLLDSQNDNLERAANLFFDPPAPPPPQAPDLWNSNNGNSFNISHSETLQPDNFPPTAPSRPSSRTSGRQNVVDLTKDSEMLPFHPAASREDEDLKRAVELSKLDQGWNTQENGVIDNAGRTYEAITETQYSDNMAVIPYAGSSAHEIVLSPDPVARRREIGEPAFLRPSPAAHSLAAFLTILNQIPLARATMLLPQFSLPDYGFSETWWDGDDIQLASLSVGDHDEMPLDALLVAEVQRVVAFLNGTTRAYGSADVLAKYLTHVSRGQENALTQFVTLWTEAAKRLSPDETNVANLFAGLALCDEPPGTEIAFKDVTLDQSLSLGPTLYDQIDSLMWANQDETMRIGAVPEVFLIQIRQTGFGNTLSPGFTVPSTFYFDRYLAENAPKVAQARLELQKVQETMTKLEDTEALFKSFKHPKYPDREFDPLKLLESTAQALAQTGVPNGVDTEHDHPATEHLKNAHDRILGTLGDVQKQKYHLEQRRDEIRSLLTDPYAMDAAERPKYPYYLMGICVEAGVTYMLCPVDPQDLTGNTPDALKSGYQWWRIKFSSSQVATIEKEKVPEALALKAAREDGRSGILVYASEMAMENSHSAVTPQALTAFVDTDNAAFAHELNPAVPLASPKPQRMPTIFESGTPPPKAEVPLINLDGQPEARSPKRKAAHSEHEEEPARQRPTTPPSGKRLADSSRESDPFSSPPTAGRRVARISARPPTDQRDGSPTPDSMTCEEMDFGKDFDPDNVIRHIDD